MKILAVENDPCSDSTYHLSQTPQGWILKSKVVQFSSVYFRILTKHRILNQECRDRKQRP